VNWPTFLYPDPKRGPDTITIVKHPRDRAREDAADRPWYYRPPTGHASGKGWHSLGTASTPEAIAAARAFLDAWSGDSARHHRAQAILAGPAQTTVADLATEWVAAGCPDRDERPRAAAAAARLKSVIERTAPFWPMAPGTIGRETIREFARTRRAAAAKARTGSTGDRVIDLELAALSCLFQWAVAVEKVESNPFRDRPRFRRASDVQHCNASRPATDEELHAILRWLWSDGSPANHKAAGAHLAWCALTGQRPGEAGALRVDGTAIGDRRPPGTRWTLRDGSERIAVARLKNGINPAVRVHPALDAFLRAWLRYRTAQWPDSPWYFPHPADPTRPLASEDDGDTPLNRALDAATEALQLPHRKPHAMRAFYVRVRRSDGVDDATIAVELGQGSGPGLVVNTYGRADDILGDGAFDWLPDAGEPAWAALEAQAPASNVIQLRQAA